MDVSSCRLVYMIQYVVHDDDWFDSKVSDNIIQPTHSFIIIHILSGVLAFLYHHVLPPPSAINSTCMRFTQ
eukprot:526855-Pyramimonas_sp.AAC.1